MKKMRVVTFWILSVFIVTAGPASASCLMPPPLKEAIAQSPVVFVGEVLKSSNSDRTATVQVIEIWKGSVPEGTVEVLGGPEADNTATSVDRTFEAGVTYLFVLYQGMKDGRFQDNSCSSTRPYKDHYDSLRPASAQVLSPNSGGRDVAQGVAFPIVPVVLVVLLLVAGLVILISRRSADSA